ANAGKATVIIPAPAIASEISVVTISNLATPDLLKLYKFLCFPFSSIPVRSTLNNTLSPRGKEWYSLTFCPDSLVSAAIALPTAPAPMTVTGNFFKYVISFIISLLLLKYIQGLKNEIELSLLYILKI